MRFFYLRIGSTTDQLGVRYGTSSGFRRHSIGTQTPESRWNRRLKPYFTDNRNCMCTCALMYVCTCTCVQYVYAYVHVFIRVHVFVYKYTHTG